MLKSNRVQSAVRRACFEPLEGRQLMAASADLAVGIVTLNLAATSPLDSVTKGAVKIQVGNTSAEAFGNKAFNKVRVDVELVVGASDAKGYLIGQIKNFSVAGLTESKPLTATIPLTIDGRKAKSGAYKIPAGDYKIRITVDAANQVAEGDETNNAAVATQTESLKAPFADLVPHSFTTTFKGTVASGAKGQGVLQVKNVGNATATGKFDVLVTTTLPDIIDPATKKNKVVVVGQAKRVAISLAPNAIFALPKSKLALTMPVNPAGKTEDFALSITLTPSGIKGDVTTNNQVPNAVQVTQSPAAFSTSSPLIPTVGSTFTFTKSSKAVNSATFTNELGGVVDNTTGRTGTYQYIVTTDHPPVKAGQTLYMAFQSKSAKQLEVALHYTKVVIKDANGGGSGALPITLSGRTIKFGVPASQADGQVSFKDTTDAPITFKFLN
jgi:CARDB